MGCGGGTVDPRFPGVQPSSYLNFLDCAQQNTSLTGLAAYAFSAMGMTRNSETQNVLGLVVTGNYFDLLEVKPVLGRTFLSGEDTTPNGHPVAVLGYKFWQKLGGNAEIVGSTITKLAVRARSTVTNLRPGCEEVVRTPIGCVRQASRVDSKGW